VATIYKTTGGFGRGCSDGGTSMSLTTLEARLGAYRCAYRGLASPVIAPIADTFTYIVIQVHESDEKTAKFPRKGYYVADVRVESAAFLFKSDGA